MQQIGASVGLAQRKDREEIVEKICRTMSASENPVRRSDARPTRPARTRRETMWKIIAMTYVVMDGVMPSPGASR
jgi:hypothetical protein